MIVYSLKDVLQAGLTRDNLRSSSPYTVDYIPYLVVNTQRPAL